MDLLSSPRFRPPYPPSLLPLTQAAHQLGGYLPPHPRRRPEELRRQRLRCPEPRGGRRLSRVGPTQPLHALARSPMSTLPPQLWQTCGSRYQQPKRVGVSTVGDALVGWWQTCGSRYQQPKRVGVLTVGDALVRWWQPCGSRYQQPKRVGVSTVGDALVGWWQTCGSRYQQPKRVGVLTVGDTLVRWWQTCGSRYQQPKRTVRVRAAGPGRGRSPGGVQWRPRLRPRPPP